jgi:hypothetical protein
MKLKNVLILSLMLIFLINIVNATSYDYYNYYAPSYIPSTSSTTSPYGEIFESNSEFEIYNLPG